MSVLGKVKSEFFKLIPLIMMVLLTGCDTLSLISSDINTYHSRYPVTYDVVRNSYRMTWQEHHNGRLERITPFIYAQSTWIKEEFKNGEVNYRVYVEMSLEPHTAALADSVYLITDHLYYPIPLEERSSEAMLTHEVVKEKILTADSQVVEVLTELNSMVENKQFFGYTVDQVTMAKIVKSQKLYYRYYVGDLPITLPVSERTLSRLAERVNLDMKRVYLAR